MDLKDRLAELRREKGWSQDELALKLSVTRQAISKWERGAAVPSMENLVYIGRLYGIPLDELVNGERQCEEPPATAVAVEEKAEAAGLGKKLGLLRLVRGVAAAMLILLVATASVITIVSAVFKEPEKTKDGLSIIGQNDLEVEEVDLTEVINIPEENSGIIFTHLEKEDGILK